jgi:RNA polymerase sigma factor (sigma-70 family)
VRRERAVDVVPLGSSADEAAAVDERQRLLAALRQLPAKQRAVLVLRHYEGLSDEEIAVVMQTSAVTVRSNVHRGLANLRAALTRLDETSEGGLR